MESFLLLASVYLLTMIIAVPVSARLGLGSVLGYLIAGILIGPVLGIAGHEMHDLQHFAEFGVVMMLFLIGLELEPRVLWNMRRKLVGLGLVQILATMFLIMGVVMALGQGWRVSLAIGMILSLSSTAIVLQTLSEKRLMQTSGGRSIFSVLLTQDIAVIPMIALMPLLAVTSNAPDLHEETVGGAFMASLPGWGAAIVTLGAVVAVIVLGHFAIRPVFNFVQSARLREMETAFSLLIVVGIASLMSFVGLSPALGTFLAGVMLAGSEFRHELEAQIEPFKGLLLGLFFITVGAGMNFALLAAFPASVLGATVALIGVKMGVLWLIAQRGRMKHQPRVLFTLSLAQAGEFGFVLISYAVALRILGGMLAEGLLLVIALSMLATPLLFIAYDQLMRRRSHGVQAPIADEIDDQQPIIIAGIGRFGQVVNRLVTSSGFQTTVLDHDLRTIQLMRRFGVRGYFGDPTRPEILAAAGLDKAQVLVAALDDPEANLKLVRYAREKRPDLRITARARDRVAVYALHAAGADHVVREMFDSALRVGRYVLEDVGLSEYEASELEKIFYKLDRASLRELAEVWVPGKPTEEQPAYVELSRKLNADLEAALMERFSDGPSAGPIYRSDDDPEPEHNLKEPIRAGGRPTR